VAADGGGGGGAANAWLSSRPAAFRHFCPAHKGATGNEKADEWVEFAVDEPDARGWNG